MERNSLITLNLFVKRFVVAKMVKNEGTEVDELIRKDENCVIKKAIPFRRDGF